MKRISRSIAIAAVTALTAGCGDSLPTGIPANAVLLPADRVQPVAREQYAGIEDRRRQVIRDAEAWTGFWAELTKHVSPAPAPPVIDFERAMVVVAAMGLRPSGGYAIEIGGVYQGDGIYVSVRERSPGRRCTVADVITAPVDAVVVPRSDLPLRFVERSTIRNC